MNYTQALTHAGLKPDVRYHQLYLQGVAAGMEQAREAMENALDTVETERDLYRENSEDGAPDYILDTIIYLREALDGKAAIQEPTVWADAHGNYQGCGVISNAAMPTPVQRIPESIICPFCESEHVPGWLHDMKMDIKEKNT